MTYRSLATVRVVLTVSTVTRRLDLLVPTTAPPGALEQVAGLLHQATRGDRDRVSLLLQGQLRASGEHARTLRNARAQAGLLARATPVPEVVIRALDLVDRHGGLRDEGIRGLLHAAGLSQGSADRALVLGLAGFYGLTEACSRAEQREILAVMPPLVSIGAWSSDICWTEPQRRELRRRRGVPDGPWLVRCDDWTSRLSHSVQRYLAVRSPATVAELLLGARRYLSGMQQRHLLPDEPGLRSWVLQQDWLVLDLRGHVRSRVDLPLTSVDKVIVQALPPGKVAPRAVPVQALVAAGYTKGSAEVTVHQTPYVTQVARGLIRR